MEVNDKEEMELAVLYDSMEYEYQLPPLLKAKIAEALEESLKEIKDGQ
jgi:hypothetical protein